MNNFSQCFQSQILEKFKDNEITMLHLIDMFPRICESGILSKLEKFRNNVKQAFDTPMDSFITETVSSMKSIYLRIADISVAANHYYGSQGSLRNVGSNMSIWRIPVGI